MTASLVPMNGNAVRSGQRFNRNHRCPICDGSENDPRGQERRCFGYLSSDGLYAHCSRAERAGTLDAHATSNTFAHRLRGPCKCGVTHGNDDTQSREAEATYRYLDEKGVHVMDVVRFPGKQFRQRKADGTWKLDGVRRVPYRLPELLAAGDGIVFVVEGEKDVETLRSHGLIATCNPGGAGKWHTVADSLPRAFAGRDVVIIPDGDEVGRKHAADVALSLSSIAASVRLVEVPGAKDATDWFRAGGTVEALQDLVARIEPGSPVQQTADNTRPRWHRMPDLVETIMVRARDPWIPLTLGDEEIARVRQGGMVVIMGPTGSGKTSFVAGLLVAHARERGPVVVLSRELPADELAARAIGMQLDASWFDVLTGKVMRSEMDRAANLPRMVVLERRDAHLAGLSAAIESLRGEWPGESILVAIDYVQIIESQERETRAKVADVISQIDDIARAHSVVVLAISQMSRAASTASRAGEKMGVASADAGAESAAIERAATLTLAIGSSGPQREDGTCAVDLSIGKARMGQGDRVLPMSYCGKSGRWRVAGDARPAADVRAEKVGRLGEAKVNAARLAMVAYADRSDEPVTGAQLIAQAHQGKDTGRAALRLALELGELVEVRLKKPRAPTWQLWTRARAEASGVSIVERGSQGTPVEQPAVNGKASMERWWDPTEGATP